MLNFIIVHIIIIINIREKLIIFQEKKLVVFILNSYIINIGFSKSVGRAK